MTIYYLLIENVDLEEVRKGEKDKKEKTLKFISSPNCQMLNFLRVKVNVYKELNSAYISFLSFKSRINCYDHRVKWFTTKNKKKRIKMFKRSSKRITKTRQMTPHAMCRHMVWGKKATFEVLRHVADQRLTHRQREGQTGWGGIVERHRGTVRERITQNTPLPPNQSICLICHFLPCCDPISTEWSEHGHHKQHLSSTNFN